MNSHEALVSAATAGLGIIQVADYYAHSRLQRGELVEILRAFKTEGHIIPAGPPLRLSNAGRALRFLRTVLGSVAAIRLTEPVLNGPTVLTSVRSPKSAGPIVSSVTPVPESIPIPITRAVIISVTRAVIVAIATRTVAA
jgi:hypothetical protein